VKIFQKTRTKLIPSTMSRCSPTIELFRSEVLRCRMRADSEDPFYGLTPLHIACSIGVPPDDIAYLLSQNCTHPVEAVTDIEGMVPLHHIVQAICDGKIPYDDGIAIIKMLCDADSTMIYKADKKCNTPIDIVQISTLKSSGSSTSSCSKERLIQYLRSISFAVYRQKKSRWEAKGIDPELQDNKSRSRSNSSDLRVTPLCNGLYDDNSFDSRRTTLQDNKSRSRSNCSDLSMTPLCNGLYDDNSFDSRSTTASTCIE